MADVAKAERAQLILVAGLALAVVLVALALILNSVIFTENLATRNEASDVEAATEFRGETYDSVARGIVHVNDVYRGDGFTTMYRDEYRPVLRNISDSTATGGSVAGIASDVDDEHGYPGTQIVDDNESKLQTFTPRVGVSTGYWTVAKNVTFRRYRLTAKKAALAQLTLSDVKTALRNEDTVVFYIGFTDSRDRTWYLAIWKDSSGNMNIVSYDKAADTFSEVCSTSGTEAALDFARQTFAGSNCNAFDFTEQLAGKTTIKYWTGDLAAGTYRLVVDRSHESLRDVVNTANYGDQCTSETFYRTTHDKSPYTAPAVYSTIVNATYRSSSAEYDGEIYVEPEAIGPNSGAPTVTQFDVSDSSGTDHEFSVTWNTSEPKRDPVTVNLTMIDSGGNVVDRVTGLPPSGTETLKDSALLSLGPYTLVVEAVDSNGNSRSVEQLHDDDGDALTDCPP